MRYQVRGQHHDVFGPIVICGLEIPSLNIIHPGLPFLLDTGSSVTTLSNYFVRILNINYNDADNLRPAGDLTGIGGTVSSYFVENANLLFVTTSNIAINFPFPNWSFRISRVDHPDATVRERIINTNFINIIGRDVLLEQEIRFSYERNGVLLEIDIP